MKGPACSSQDALLSSEPVSRPASTNTFLPSANSICGNVTVANPCLRMSRFIFLKSPAGLDGGCEGGSGGGGWGGEEDPC